MRSVLYISNNWRVFDLVPNDDECNIEVESDSSGHIYWVKYWINSLGYMPVHQDVFIKLAPAIRECLSVYWEQYYADKREVDGMKLAKADKERALENE